MKAIARYLLALSISMLTWQAQAEPYVLHTSGTMVLDKATGLVWMRCTLGGTWFGGSCVGIKRRLDFEDAIETAKKLNRAGGFGGYSDWLVPKVRQLHGLVNCFNTPRFKVYWTQFEIDGEVVAQQMKHYCTTDGNRHPFIHPTAFPNTSISIRYWSSSSYKSSPSYANDGDFAWYVAFGNGGVTDGFRAIEGHIRLVREHNLLTNEVAAGFTQQLPLAIEVLRAAQKSKL